MIVADKTFRMKQIRFASHIQTVNSIHDKQRVKVPKSHHPLRILLFRLYFWAPPNLPELG